MMVDSGDNHEIASIAIILTGTLMLRGGLTAVVGQMEGRLRVLVSISQFGSITTLYLPTNDICSPPVFLIVKC